MTPKPYKIPKALVWEAFQNVKNNGGAAGIDQQTIEQFEERLGDNLYKLWNRMCSGSYFPPPVKAVPIPKKTGCVRVLGVPTVADRVAQTVVKLWLEPKRSSILCFTRTPYGYRPGRSAHDAIAVTKRRCWELDWVVEFDIKGLLDTVSYCPLVHEPHAVVKPTASDWLSGRSGSSRKIRFNCMTALLAQRQIDMSAVQSVDDLAQMEQIAEPGEIIGAVVGIVQRRSRGRLRVPVGPLRWNSTSDCHLAEPRERKGRRAAVYC